MKLSTKVRYGTRAMLDLAVHYGNGPVLLKDIAKRQEVSLKYLDQIFSSLRAVGLVKSLRGAKGGFVLNIAPSKITVNQIVEALEGPLELVECVNNKDFCHRVNACVMHDIWYELGKAMEVMLKTTTLEDLIIREKKKKKTSGSMYYI
jgi:Rrf2 family protein